MKNTPQNQYFPANAKRMAVHCLESGCIGKYIPLEPLDFPQSSGNVIPNTSLLSVVYEFILPLEDGMAEFCKNCETLPITIAPQRLKAAMDPEPR